MKLAVLGNAVKFDFFHVCNIDYSWKTPYLDIASRYDI